MNLIGRSNRLREKISDFTMKDIVESIYRELMICKIVEKCQESNNLILIGHCFGSIIAFEVARLLEANFVKVHQLVVASSVSPSTLSDHNKWIAIDRRKTEEEERKKRMKQSKLLQQDPQQIQQEEKMRRSKEHRERLREDVDLLAQALASGGTPSLLVSRPDLMSLMLPMIRSDRLFRDDYQLTVPDFEFEASDSIDRFSNVLRLPQTVKVRAAVLILGNSVSEPLELKKWKEISTFPSEVLNFDGTTDDFLSDSINQDQLIQLLSRLCPDISSNEVEEET